MSYLKSVVISAKSLITCKYLIFLFLNYYNGLAEMNGLTKGEQMIELWGTKKQ